MVRCDTLLDNRNITDYIYMYKCTVHSSHFVRTRTIPDSEVPYFMLSGNSSLVFGFVTTHSLRSLLSTILLYMVWMITSTIPVIKLSPSIAIMHARRILFSPLLLALPCIALCRHCTQINGKLRSWRRVKLCGQPRWMGMGEIVAVRYPITIIWHTYCMYQADFGFRWSHITGATTHIYCNQLHYVRILSGPLFIL